jgi:YcaO-like protein with predicted kinase domain
LQPFVASLERASVEKTFFDGTRRICAPSETFDRVAKLFPIFGITRVANLTGLDRVGVPVYAAYRPNSRSLCVAQGKGCTHEAAKASAVMESIESHHAETIHLPLKLCSYNELIQNERCVDVARLPRLKDSSFNANQRILWIEGTDLFTHQSKWVPFECVHVDYRDPLPAQSGFVSSSNGLSSGNNYHESILHGLCEVIERDALTLWTLKAPERQLPGKIALNTVNDSRVANVLERFFEADIDVGLWDISSDIGIPAFLCRTLPKLAPDISGIRPASGMGCHLSRDIALLRAVTEAAQSRLTFISGARDDMPRAEYERYLGAEEYGKWHKSINHDGMKDYRRIRSVETATFDDDLALLLKELHNNGITEAIAVNLTKDEFSIPVTRVIVPGLEAPLSKKGIMTGARAGRLLRTEGS